MVKIMTPYKYFKRLKDRKSLLIFSFGLPWAKNSVVSMGKRFKLRGGSYQEASHVLRTFALIVSAHPYCARKSTCHAMPRHASSARAKF